VRGKTVTVRLSSEEVRLHRGWIANARRLDKLLTEMERISHRLTEREPKARAPASGQAPVGTARSLVRSRLTVAPDALRKRAKWRNVSQTDES
jgi:hypothetical protein